MRIRENRVLWKIFGSNADKITGDWKGHHNGGLMSVLLTKDYAGDKINVNGMGGECGTYGGQERCMHGFGVGDQRKSDPLEYIGVDGRMILKCILNKWDGIWLRVGTGGRPSLTRN
jgi:hypothetical protein